MKKLIVLVLTQLVLLEPLAATLLAQTPPEKDSRWPAYGTQVARPVPVPEAGQPDYYRGVVDGSQSASQYHSANGWTTGGFACGLFLGLIGTVVISAVSTGGNVQPIPQELMRIEDESRVYRLGFMDGYNRTALSRNFSNATLGGLLGTAVLVGVVLAVRSANK